MNVPNKPPEKAEDPPTVSPDEPGSDRSSRVDEMGEASFPASDPPAVWTWETPNSGR